MGNLAESLLQTGQLRITGMIKTPECQRCGVVMVGRHHLAQFCYDCQKHKRLNSDRVRASKPRESGRTCLQCHVSIDARAPQSKRCEPCQAKHNKIKAREYNHKTLGRPLEKMPVAERKEKIAMAFMPTQFKWVRDGDIVVQVRRQIVERSDS